MKKTAAILLAVLTAGWIQAQEPSVVQQAQEPSAVQQIQELSLGQDLPIGQELPLEQDLSVVQELPVEQELSVEQENELRDIGQQYTRKASMIEDMIQAKLTDLALELAREGRLATEKDAKEASDNVNEILKDMSDLYGEFIKSRVAFILDSKNVLTMEQRLHVLAQLEPDQLLHYEDVEYLQPELFELPIDLDIDQRKKLVRLEADLIIKEVKLERDTELVMLELEAIFTADEVDTDRVDKQVMQLAELAAKTIDNRVDFFIDAKDVLTLEQKRLLAYMMGL